MSPAADAGAIVFDLDGTLIDSRRDLATAVNRTRADLDLAPLTVERVEGMVGEGARALVARALGDAAGSTAGLDRALEIFRLHYHACCLETTRAYPGIAELLRDLASRRPLAVLTNKPEGPTRKILEHLGLAAAFRLVVGGDTLAARKPHPAGLRHIAAQLGVAVASLVLVGDSRFDAEAAAAAGCRAILVEWGYGRSDELAGLRPDARVRSVAELRSVLAEQGSILSS